MMMKKCCGCKKRLKLDKFWRHSQNPNGDWKYQTKCISCMKAYAKNLPKGTIKKRKALQDLKFIGLTENDYLSMYESQNGCCYICHKTIANKFYSKKEDGGYSHIDHDHKTNKIRKLLCSNCNTALGLLKDDINLFYKCIDYLKEHQQQ